MTQIAFVGDVAFSKHFEKSCFDENMLDKKIVDYLSSSDYTVVNMEGAVNDGPIQVDKPLTHANPLECVDWMRKINGSIWNLANNHLMDCGVSGLKSTLDVAKNNNFSVIGGGMDINDAAKPFIIDRDGGIGIISVTYSKDNRADINTPGCLVAEDEKEVARQIRKIKERNRWCIVVSHVGQEFSQMPMPFLRRRYKRYLKYGADIVVGHHPHVVQNYERFGDKIVFYSLGNFIFDTDYQRAQSYTDLGMLIRINFKENEYSWDFLTVKNNRENMKISEGKTPEIFRNINGIEYSVLWPLVARQLYKNERKKNIFNHPERKDKPWFWWIVKFDFKKCKKQQGRDMLLGRFLSLFCWWKLGNNNLIDYINER